MDETSFEFDTAQLAEASRRFPAHRLTLSINGGGTDGRPNRDVSYLASANYLATATEFGRHAWDEGGHI